MAVFVHMSVTTEKPKQKKHIFTIEVLRRLNSVKRFPGRKS